MCVLCVCVCVCMIKERRRERESTATDLKTRASNRTTPSIFRQTGFEASFADGCACGLVRGMRPRSVCVRVCVRVCLLLLRVKALQCESSEDAHSLSLPLSLSLSLPAHTLPIAMSARAFHACMHLCFDRLVLKKGERRRSQSGPFSSFFFFFLSLSLSLSFSISELPLPIGDA